MPILAYNPFYTDLFEILTFFIYNIYYAYSVYSSNYYYDHLFYKLLVILVHNVYA